MCEELMSIPGSVETKIITWQTIFEIGPSRVLSFDYYLNSNKREIQIIQIKKKLRKTIFASSYPGTVDFCLSSF